MNLCFYHGKFGTDSTKCGDAECVITKFKNLKKLIIKRSKPICGIHAKFGLEAKKCYAPCNFLAQLAKDNEVEKPIDNLESMNTNPIEENESHKENEPGVENTSEQMEETVNVQVNSQNDLFTRYFES